LNNNRMKGIKTPTHTTPKIPLSKHVMKKVIWHGILSMWTVALLTTNDSGTLEKSQFGHILCILLMTIQHNTMICEEEPKLLKSPQLLINPNAPLMPNPTSYLIFIKKRCNKWVERMPLQLRLWKVR